MRSTCDLGVEDPTAERLRHAGVSIGLREDNFAMLIRQRFERMESTTVGEMDIGLDQPDEKRRLRAINPESRLFGARRALSVKTIRMRMATLLAIDF